MANERKKVTGKPLGVSKVVGFIPTSESLVPLDLYRRLYSVTPVLDQFRASLQSNASLSAISANRIRFAAKSAGIPVGFKYPRANRKKTLRSDLLVSPRGNVFGVEYAFNGNAILHLQNVWDLNKKGTLSVDERSLDGSANFLESRILKFCSEDAFSVQADWVENAVETGRTRLVQVFSCAKMDRPELSLRLHHVEIAWHLETSPDRAGTDLFTLCHLLRFAFSDINVSGIDSSGGIKGVSAVVEPDLKIAIYQKTPRSIRIEVRYDRLFLKTWAKTQASGLSPTQILKRLSVHAWGLVKRCLDDKDERDHILLLSDAITNIARACGGKTFPNILTRLLEGEGLMLVRSKEIGVYSSVKALRRKAIIQNIQQGKYALAPEYRVILQAGIISRAMFRVPFSIVSTEDRQNSDTRVIP